MSYGTIGGGSMSNILEDIIAREIGIAYRHGKDGSLATEEQVVETCTEELVKAVKVEFEILIVKAAQDADEHMRKFHCVVRSPQSCCKIPLTFIGVEDEQ